MSELAAIEGKLSGVLLIKPRVFEDARGYFTETYHAERYREAGIEGSFVQDNLSFSRKHVLRGLHFQWRHPQGKLVHVTQGEVFDVAVDLRWRSPTFGQWEGHCLSSENHHQLYIPEGFGHGFVVLSDTAQVVYKCTTKYRPDDDRGVLWSDPDLGIAWPVETPVLSEKDARLPLLRDMAETDMPAAT